MAPVEVEYGTYWEDKEFDGFLNEKESLPVKIGPGKRKKLTYKAGKNKLELEVSCDKGDHGSTVTGKVTTSEGMFGNSVGEFAYSIGPGMTQSAITSKRYPPVVGFSARHVGKIVEEIRSSLVSN